MTSEERLKDHIARLDGYQLTDTHFKIGTKLHASNFFYAKRLFQNSYYTARIALLLTIEIKKILPDKTRYFTIVGYEMYSELLLSLVIKFLSDYGYEHANHFVTLDNVSGIERLPRNAKTENIIFVIVPITSTGGTSRKIEDYLKTLQATEPVIHHFTVLQAVDETKPDLITAKHKSIIKLNSQWQHPLECRWCFDNSGSKPLYETDKTSLTPALIFDYPSAKETSGEDLAVDFEKVRFDNTIAYRQVKRNDEHYLYATKTDRLIDANKKTGELITWLARVKQVIKILPTQRIIILSPCHHTNMSFINLVNDHVFNSSATVIHHQTDGDYISNFKLLNKSYLTVPNTRIYYVDDTLISGGTFFKLYDLYRYTTDYDDNNIKRMSGVILLNNKSSPDVHKRVRRAAGSIYSFVNINLPTLPTVFGSQPLAHEVKRYRSIADSALLDVPKRYFYEKALNIDSGNIRPDKQIISEVHKRNARYLDMFKATHLSYNYFRRLNNGDIGNSFDIDDLLKEAGHNTMEGKMSLMKVLSQYPFLLYMPVRNTVFAWHKRWLNDVVNNISQRLKRQASSDHKTTLSYSEFSEFKFIIRRAVSLGNYNIISRRVMVLVGRLFNLISQGNAFYSLTHSGAVDLFAQNRDTITSLDQDEIKNLHDFHIYVLYQYLELIHKHKWCAVVIINNLNSVQKELVTPQAKQFVRMMKIELAMVVDDFYTTLQKSPGWKDLYKYPNADDTSIINKDIVYDENNELINRYLDRPLSKNLLRSSQFEIVKHVLQVWDRDGLNKQFLNYLWVKQFINTDQRYKISDIELSKKTTNIFEKLKSLFEESSTIGAFFIVTDGKDHPHLVYDQDSKGHPTLIDLLPEKHKVITEFLNGEKDEQDISLKTVVEYKRIAANTWTDIYRLSHSEKSFHLEIDANWIILIRISDPNIDSIKEYYNDKDGKDQVIHHNGYKTLGLMAFYSEEESDELLPKQLLMLLRKDIGSFIKKHHKNDEFFALREEEAVKRFAYLAGHGRQMMQKLAMEPNTRIVFEKAIGTLERLQYLIATKLIKTTMKNSMNNQLSDYFPETEVSKSTIEEIETMGNAIYKSKYVENEVELSTPLVINEDINFKFNEDIFKCLCMELIINAKKNRYHFINSITDTCECNKKNGINITLETSSNAMTLKVASTGPKFSETDRTKINSGQFRLIKTEAEVSGLHLFYSVLQILNTANTIGVEEPVLICKSCNLYLNTIIVKLIRSEDAQ